MLKEIVGLKKYNNRPSEENELQADIVSWLESLGYQIVTGGTLDLTIAKTGQSGSKHIELKVGLSRDELLFPISPKQWSLLDAINNDDSHAFNNISRALLYNFVTREYLFSDLTEISSALPKQGNSTTYLKKYIVKGLSWEEDQKNIEDKIIAWLG